MDNPTLIISFAISFLVTFFFTKIWIRKARKGQLTGKDIHKKDKRIIPEMGGIAIISGFLIGVLSYVAVSLNDNLTDKSIIIILGILCSLMITTIIGLIDDVLGWKIGLRQYEKPLITLLAVVPVAVVTSAYSSIIIPFLGEIYVGALFPILIVPAVILITTNGFNMLAGYNGLEAGLGIIMLTTLGFLAFNNGIFWPGTVAFIMVFALMGFMIYNYYPSQIFPGDSMTYSVGALIGIVALTAHIEHALAIIFIPYVIEFFMKLRGKFQKESFARLRKNGSLYTNHVYGLEHLTIRVLSKIKKDVWEKDVVYALWAVQAILGVVAWLVIA